MQCELCHGSGKIRVSHGLLHGGGEPLWLFSGRVDVCPDCNGSGIAHCCDGLVEQPRQDKDD